MSSKNLKRNALADEIDDNIESLAKRNKKRQRKPSDKSKKIPENIFTRLVSDAGVVFDYKGNKVLTDPITFAKKLDKIILARDGNINDTKEALIVALEETIEDEQLLISCLMPTELAVSLDTLGITSSQLPNSFQDSVMKLLMRCAHVQTGAIKCLLKKLPLYSENETVKIDPCFGIAETSGADIVNIPRLILNQLRWLDVVYSSSDIASEMLEIASVMHSEIACDIIAFIPDLLPDDGEQEIVALKLCDLLKDGPENITSGIFDALSNLYLSDHVKKKVQQLALAFLTTSSSADIPIISKYLLQSCNSVETAKEIIEVLHPHLDFSSLAANSCENVEVVVTNSSLLADVMFSSMQFRNCIGAAWLSILEKTRSLSFNSGHVVALLLLCDVSNSSQRKNAISLLHSKLKHGLIPNDVIKKTVKTCSHIISTRFDSIRHLTQSMLWHSNTALKHASGLLYEEFLLHLDGHCKQECIGMLVEHISSLTTGKDSETSIALDVLTSISITNPPLLAPYVNFLRDALDRMDAMTLNQVRTSYQILTRLAFSASDALTLGIRDDLHMMLQKQLTHVSNRLKHIGIIGSIAVIFEMSKATRKTEVTEKVDSLFKLITYVLQNDIKGWSLFFDEIFITLQMDSKVPEFLLKRLNDEAQTKLQEKFLTDYDGTCASTSTAQDLICCYRFGLLSAEEQKETDLGITLSTLLLTSQNRYMSTLLCSLFRAISSIERNLNNTLGEIDALLCCPVCLNDVAYENPIKFKELSVDMQMLVLDSLFALLNWFRELVSVFSIETDSEVQMNVLVRLKQICDIQTTIETLLPYASETYLPIHVNSSSDNSALKLLSRFSGTKANNKNQSASHINSTLSVTQDNCKSQCGNASLLKVSNKKSKKEKKSTFHAEKPSLLCIQFRPFLRELNKEVFVLLKLSLRCETSKTDKEDIENNKFLRPRHLILLLNDLNGKLKHRLGAVRLPVGFGNQVNCSVGFEQIDHVSVCEIAKLSGKLCPQICKYLEDVNAYFRNQPEKKLFEDDLDESLSTVNDKLEMDENERLVACYETLIELLNTIFSWHGLEDEKNHNLLMFLMKSVSSRLNASSDKISYVLLLSNCFRYLRNFSSTIPTSHGAHTLLKLLITLYEFADEHKSQQTWMAKQLSETSLNFLKKDWTDLAVLGSSQKRNTIIVGLFHTHLKYSEDVLRSIEEFLKQSLSYLLEDPVQRESTDDAPDFPCLTKSNYYLFYKTMIEMLGVEASTVPPPSKSTNYDEDNVDLLLRWSEIVKVLDMLIRLLKTFPSRVMLAPALKYAKSTVESFIRNGIPVCEVTFREHQDDVINLLKKVQISTRQLQHAACHSKVSKDSTLTNHVPALKRCLETFVFRVKAMLVLHNCQDAFWLGNLKNRNLQGEEVLSQISPPSQTAEEVDENVDETSEQSYSESY